MMGDFHSVAYDGLVQRVSINLLKMKSIGSCCENLTTLQVSFIEVYNEKVYDLLSESFESQKRVRESANGAFVENLVLLDINSIQDIGTYLDMGIQRRAVASTKMNSNSSRSHVIFSVYLTQQVDNNAAARSIKTSKFSMIDLAGSERASNSGVSGARLMEANNINRSLSTLGDVIKVLSDNSRKVVSGRRSFVPYRNSVLTWLLKDSLGGNAWCTMLATISPDDESYNETLCTLRYVERARYIANHAVVNEAKESIARVSMLEAELLMLRQVTSHSCDNFRNFFTLNSGQIYPRNSRL
jgi:kinesin family member 1